MTIIDLAGVRVRLECQNAGLLDVISHRYAAFRATDETDAAFEVRLVWGEDDKVERAPGATLLSGGLSYAGERYELIQPGVAATISMPDRRAELVLAHGNPLAEFEYFLRTVYALLIEESGGLLLHAAGVVADGKAWLFTGHSGSGKTTVVSLLSDLLALGDDLLIIRLVDAEWIAYGTPFWNATTHARAGQTTHAPIGGIYRLVQAKQIGIDPISLAVATAELVANCPVLNGDADRVPNLLTRCRMLAGSVPVRRLRFLKDRSFWPLVVAGQTP